MAESERAYYDVHLDHAEMGTKKKDSGPVHWIGKKVRFASAQNQQQKGNMKTLIHALDNGFLWSLWRNSGFTTKFFFFSAFGLNSVEAFFLVWYSIHYSMVSPVIVFHFLNHSFHFLLMGVFGHGARMEVSERSGGGSRRTRCVHCDDRAVAREVAREELAQVVSTPRKSKE